MTLTKFPMSSSSLPKQVVKKAVSFVGCKYTAPTVTRKRCNDAGLQSTDKRRSYMRRGSKTPTMLLLANLEFDLISQDFADASDFASEPSLICEHFLLEVTRRALSATTENLFDDDIESLCAKQFRSRRESNTHSIFFNSDCETANRHHLTESRESAQRRMSVMTALKQNMEKTSISATSSPLRGRMSVDLLI